MSFEDRFSLLNSNLPCADDHEQPLVSTGGIDKLGPTYPTPRSAAVLPLDAA